MDLKDVGKETISARDAAAMFRKRISSNERPYRRVAREHLNNLVDRYEKHLLGLKHLNVDIAQRVLMVFLEGLETQKYMENLKFFPDMPREKVEHWVEMLRGDMHNISEHGITLVAFAWQTLQNYIVHRARTLKWEMVFSKSNDPIEWVRLASSYPQLFTSTDGTSQGKSDQTLLPFDLTFEELNDIREKVDAVLNTRLSADA